MVRRYSRLARTEESRNVRSAYLYILLSVVGLVLFLFLGIPVISKILGVVTNLKGDVPIIQKDSTPPAPPRIEAPPEATSKMNLDIEGSAEPGVTVLITLNANTTEVTADSEGRFTAKLPLLKGENLLFLQAKDNAGNESGKTPTYKVIQDSTKPKLTDISPADGTRFSGSQKQVTVQGTTDTDTTVRINDRVASVDEAGKFSLSIGLSEGENLIVINATDKAQNTTEMTIKLYYSP